MRDPRSVERATGIEPVSEAWEAAVLPLNYARGPRIIALASWGPCRGPRVVDRGGSRRVVPRGADARRRGERVRPACDNARVDGITVNGQARALAPGDNVARLVSELGLVGKRIAVELNGEIVPRGRHADTALKPGDRVEVVVAVGGG